MKGRKGTEEKGRDGRGRRGKRKGRWGGKETPTLIFSHFQLWLLLNSHQGCVHCIESSCHFLLSVYFIYFSMRLTVGWNIDSIGEFGGRTKKFVRLAVARHDPPPLQRSFNFYPGVDLAFLQTVGLVRYDLGTGTGAKVEQLFCTASTSAQ